MFLRCSAIEGTAWVLGTPETPEAPDQAGAGAVDDCVEETLGAAETPDETCAGANGSCAAWELGAAETPDGTPGRADAGGANADCADAGCTDWVLGEAEIPDGADGADGDADGDGSPQPERHVASSKAATGATFERVCDIGFPQSVKRQLEPGAALAGHGG